MIVKYMNVQYFNQKNMQKQPIAVVMCVAIMFNSASGLSHLVVLFPPLSLCFSLSLLPYDFMSSRDKITSVTEIQHEIVLH